MNKNLIFIFCLIILFNLNTLGQNKIAEDKETVLKEDNPPEDKKALLKVSFMYYTGDMNLSKKEEEFKTLLKTKYPKVKFKCVPFKNEFGDWGPTDYFFPLNELSEKETSAFIKEIKYFFEGVNSVQIDDKRPSFGIPE